MIVTDRLRALLSLDKSAGDAEVRKIARNRLDWFRGDARSEYARVMEKSFANSVLRQDYLLQLIRRARLSRGYIHLGALIEAGVFNTVLTPNFDYLAPQGFYRVSATPLIDQRALPIPLAESCAARRPPLGAAVALLLDLADRFLSGADRQSTLNEIDVAAQRAAGILKAGRWVVALSQPRKAGLYVVSSGGSLPKGRRFPKTMRGSFGQYQLPADVADCYVRRNSKEIGFIRFGSDEPFPVKDQDKFVRAAGKAMAGLLALRR